MNSIFIAGIALVLFVVAYRFYGRFLDKLWDIDSERKTPAFEKEDGVDYIPAKHWLILFGHHFSSIAGAGPILGPVIACMLWGWLPAALWIIFGSIFIGGVHDFGALVISLRYGGSSVGDVTQSVINRRCKILFSLFLYLSLILVVAVFASVTATTLIKEPQIVIPTFGLIFIAILFGVVIYRWHWNYVYATLLALILLVLLFVIGYQFPLSLGQGSSVVKLWIIILLLYSFVASITPVNLLLQPRDYISSFILFFGLIFGYAGLVTARPYIHTPAYISFTASAKGTLWPMMFVIIACGAISGFHSLVASGTTSKQITSEKHAKRIAYGGMLTEGILSILALLSVCAGLFWNSGISSLDYPLLMEKGDWIGTFAVGYGQITSRILNYQAGKTIAIVMINAFVLTTLDTATRITRYISQEVFGYEWNINAFKNRYFSTFIVILIAGYLAFGNWQKLWPVFGASNQLVAGIVLSVAGIFLMKKGKRALTSFIPAIFMFLTTITALIYQAQHFYRDKNYLLGNISLVLVCLAIFFIEESIRKLKEVRTKK
ncbi:MAG: carbon starvation protein A [Candidatus Omnitrophica bacterium]|nr:carbon starvation protein A [Candidatus Omnitrophota bacterium]